MLTEFAIELKEVCVDYMQNRAVDHVTWSLPAGAHAAILGPNGCGKSSLLRAITAYGHYTSGHIQVIGYVRGKSNVHELRTRLGIVDASLSRLVDEGVTAEHIVASGFFGNLATLYNQPSPAQLNDANRTLAEVGLGERGRQKFTELSDGQRSRLWLARALVNQPDLLIMDEPAADLDLLGRETLLATLDRLGDTRPNLTLIMVTHRLDDLLPSISEVLLMSAGKVVANGTPEQTLTADRLSRTFDCPVTVGKRDGRWHWSVPQTAWAGLIS